MVDLIVRLCKESGDTPAPAYFRKIRPEFVTALVESGEKGSVSVDNAVKQALTFAGDDWRDKCDMVSALGEWTAVANKVKEHTQAWSNPPQFYRVGKNLLKTPECRVTLHSNQTTERILILGSADDLERAKLDVTGDYSFVHLIHNRNPRKITDKPSMVVFKAPGSQAYALFPQETSDELVKLVLTFLAEANIVARGARPLRSYMRTHGVTGTFLDVTAAWAKAGVGRSVEAIADWTWGGRFCPIARDEWMAAPLTPAQEKHLAYFMDLMEQATLKVGVEKISVAKH